MSVDLFEATLIHLPALLMARVDGKSPVEYIRNESRQKEVRRLAHSLIEKPPETFDEIFGRIRE